MITIILVDDHVIMQDGLRGLLETESDIEIVGEANNGQQAVKIALEKKPDIVIMDIAMPDMNGIEATRQIKKENSKIKVIALSMHSEREIVVGILRAGASGYLLKASTSTELIEAIRTVSGGGKFISHKISDVVLQEISDISMDLEEIGFDRLTYRECEIVQLISKGNSTKQIAELISIRPKTVESHRANIMKKLDIHNLPELTKYAIRVGLTSLYE